MTPIRTALLVTLVAAIAFALGFQEGRNRPPPTYVLKRPALVDHPDKLQGVTRQVYEALMVPAPLERAIRLASLLQGLGAEDIPAVQAAYDSVFVDRHPLDTLIYAHWFAPLDPDGAIDWSTRPMNQAVNEVTGPAILEALAHVDPRRARGYAETLMFGAYQKPALDALVRGWDESGKPGLDKYLENMEPGFERQRRMRAVVRRRVLGDGIDGAIAWAENLPEGGYNYKLDIYRQMVTELAAVDIHRAAEFAEANFQGPYGKNLLSRLSYYWATTDGEAALAWCATLPAGEPRDKAVNSAFLTWMRWEKEAPMEWMAKRFPTIAEQEWLQPAVPPYLTRLSRTGDDGDSAPTRELELVSKLTREDIREKSLVSLMTSWMKRDRPAAEAWLASAGLAPELIKRIEENSRPVPGGGRAGKRAAAADEAGESGEPGDEG